MNGKILYLSNPDYFFPTSLVYMRLGHTTLLMYLWSMMNTWLVFLGLGAVLDHCFSLTHGGAGVSHTGTPHLQD